MEHFFHVCPFDRGGGGPKLFGQYPYRTNTFQKGASLIDSYQIGDILTTTEFSQFKIVWSQFGLHECKFIFNLGWTIKNADKTSRNQKVLPEYFSMPLISFVGKTLGAHFHNYTETILMAVVKNI